MKKTLLALGALTAFAGAASAQSSVTLFGVVDASLRHVKTGDTSVGKMGTDGNSPSRFGFRGVEDLGNGLAASFWLEAGFSPDTGTVGSKLFSRRSTVGLSGAFGEVRLGRDTLAVYNNASAFDPFGATGLGQINTLLEGALRTYTGTTATSGVLNTTVATNTVTDIRRADNQVSYFLPGGLGGVYGQLQFSAGEGARGQGNGVRLGYKGFGFDGAVAVNNIDVNSVANANAAGDLRVVNAAASYDFSVVKLVGQYAQIKLKPVGAANVKERVWQLGAIVPVSAAGAVKLSYARASEAQRANLLAIGYQHDLSKRTALYATYAHLKNKEATNGNAAAAFFLPDAPATTAALQKSRGYEVGVRHNF